VLPLSVRRGRNPVSSPSPHPQTPTLLLFLVFDLPRLVFSANYQAPATYLIAVYGRTQSQFLMVGISAASSVIDAADGQSYQSSVIATSATQSTCKYFQYVHERCVRVAFALFVATKCSAVACATAG
jgi:hypothetical protein